MRCSFAIAVAVVFSACAGAAHAQTTSSPAAPETTTAEPTTAETPTAATPTAETTTTETTKTETMTTTTATTPPAATPAASAPVAQPTPPALPQHRLFLRSTNLIRYNPLGLITDNHISFRRMLYRDDSVFLRDNFVGAGFTPQVSAAFARVGALVEVQPLSALRLWANFDVVGYFGTFGLLQSFNSPTADFSDTTITQLGQLPAGDPQKNFPTWGTQLTLGADVQLKIGPVAARNLFRLVRGSYQLRQGDTVYYDQFYDVLAPNEGFYINNDTDLLYVSDFGLVAGVRMNTTMPFYAPHQFTQEERAAGIVDHANGPTLRAGPLVSYTFFDDERALFNKPTIMVVGNWWLAHRYRTGQDVSQAVPYLVIGFQVTTDLLPHLISKEKRARETVAEAPATAEQEEERETEAEVKELREAEESEREAERAMREEEQERLEESAEKTPR